MPLFILIEMGKGQIPMLQWFGLLWMCLYLLQREKKKIELWDFYFLIQRSEWTRDWAFCAACSQSESSGSWKPLYSLVRIQESWCKYGVCSHQSSKSGESSEVDLKDKGSVLVNQLLFWLREVPVKLTQAWKLRFFFSFRNGYKPNSS